MVVGAAFAGAAGVFGFDVAFCADLDSSGLVSELLASEESDVDSFVSGGVSLAVEVSASDDDDESVSVLLDSGSCCSCSCVVCASAPLSTSDTRLSCNITTRRAK